MESIPAGWPNPLLSDRISKVPSPDIQIGKRQNRAASKLSKQSQDVNLRRGSFKPLSRVSSDKPTKTVSRSMNFRRVTSGRPPSVWSVQSEASIIQSTNRHRFLNRLASGLYNLEHSRESEGIENVDTTGTLRTDIAQLTIDVSQAKIDNSGSTFFAVDINYSVDTMG